VRRSEALTRIDELAARVLADPSDAAFAEVLALARLPRGVGGDVFGPGLDVGPVPEVAGRQRGSGGGHVPDDPLPESGGW
jgi:hypothetical protein